MSNEVNATILSGSEVRGMGSYPPRLPHIVIFPFMSKGHTIPLLHLSHLLHRRRLATITLLTTPLNAPFIRRSLAGTDTTVVELPFPHDLPDIPDGIESTDQLHSMSLFLPFIHAVRLLQPHFEHAIQRLHAVSLLISDGFLGWTNESASKLGIPRLVFYGMGNYAMTICAIVARERPHAGLASYDQPFIVPGFPNLWFTKSDFGPPFDDPYPQGPLYEFVSEQAKATRESYGILVNSFYELEAAYFDRWNADVGPKAWCVGPLCLAGPQKSRPDDRSERMEWLDSRSAMNRPVLYVAFGSQAQLSAAQLQEIANGLERSRLDFLWVVRASGGSTLLQSLEERLRERGKVVSEWVDQTEILGHDSIKGFVSHCGWNSVMESVCAGVPILAWPMMAEQHLNAKLVVELGIGLRVRTSDGKRDGLVRGEEIDEMARELILGEKGKEAAEKVKEYADPARKAMENGGRSWCSLEFMIDEICNKRS